MSLQEAAAQAEELAQAGSERELSQLRAQWDDELEAQARSADFRERALAFRAVGMFRWRAKEELLRRGLDDGSPAARGSALLSLEMLSRDHPSTVNSVRPLLHKMLADGEENSAVRRLAVLALKNGSAQRDTGLADRVEHVGRQRVAAVLLHHVRAGLTHVPVELDAGRLENAPRGLSELRPRAVAGNEDDPVRHGRERS